MQRISFALAIVLALGCGAMFATAIGGPDAWTYDPDPEVEAVWQDVDNLKAEVARLEKAIEVMLVSRESRLSEAKSAQAHWRERVARANKRARDVQARTQSR